MKFTEKAEEIAYKLVELFKTGNPGRAMAHIFIKQGGRHCDNWSFNNRLITILYGYTDAMGFKQWLAKGRVVKKGEKAFYILAPLTCKGKKNVNGVETEYMFIRGFRGLPVFGYEQTEGEPIEFVDNEHINSLPLLEVAKHWGVDVGTYNGNKNRPCGYFSPNQMHIMLGVKNLSTWLHELVHVAENKLGRLTADNYQEQKLEAEIVAELGATVLAHCLGLGDAADDGGCWEYIKSYSERYKKEPCEAAYRLIDRTCEAVNHILKTNEEINGDVSTELATT
jgi:antirestriction protein ArdC